MNERIDIEERDIEQLARKVLDILSSTITPRAKVILLEGDLGSGKTTFTKTFASLLGINEDDVHSPTFILKKEYMASHHYFRRLVHIDAYRFDTPKESKVLSLEENLASPSTIIAIEWPSKMYSIRPDLVIEFDVMGDTTRRVTLKTSVS